MKIQEAIKILQESYPKKCRMVNGRLVGGFDDTDSEKGKAIGIAIDCMEECMKNRNSMRIKEIHCDEYYCPACGSENNCDDGIVSDHYCPNCGQKLDWEVEE